MPRDYAKKNTSTGGKKRQNRRPNKRKAKTSAPRWLWLVSGALAGAFVMFLLHLNGLTPSQQAPITKSETTIVEAPAPAGSDDEQAISKPRLQFYQLLKESTVDVPEPDTTNLAKNPADEILYILQAGSFRSTEDANRMRAEIILMNLSASVDAVRGKNDQTWYRVMVGPFDSRSRMAKARSMLVSHDINPLLLKRSKDE